MICLVKAERVPTKKILMATVIVKLEMTPENKKEEMSAAGNRELQCQNRGTTFEDFNQLGQDYPEIQPRDKAGVPQLLDV